MWTDLWIPFAGICVGVIGVGMAVLQAVLARMQVRHAQMQEFNAREQVASAHDSALAAQRAADAAERQLELVQQQTHVLNEQSVAIAEQRTEAMRARQRQSALALAEAGKINLAQMRLFLRAVRGAFGWGVKRAKDNMARSSQSLDLEMPRARISLADTALEEARLLLSHESYQAEQTLLFICGKSSGVGPTEAIENRFDRIEQAISSLRQGAAPL